jgi:hypothetical protein
MNGGEFPDLLSDYWLLKKYFAACSYAVIHSVGRSVSQLFSQLVDI